MPVNEYAQPVGEPVPGWTPRPPVQPVELVGRTCRLEPLAASHVAGLYEAMVEGSSAKLWTYLFAGPFEDRPAFTAYVEALIANPGVVPLAVLDDRGTPLGVATYLRIDADQGSVETGHLAFSDALQRSTTATEAHILMARHVLDDLGYRRYEWKCDSLNEPSHRAATRLGFSYEGRFARAVVYKGRNRDTDWFAITDLDWPRVRTAYDAWLDPANFDATGVQRTSLSELTRDAR